MKKFVSICLLFCILFAAFIFLPSEWRIWNPKVDPLPNYEEEGVIFIKAFTSRNVAGTVDDKSVQIVGDDYSKVLHYLDTAEPTRIQSHTDSVYGEDYRGIRIKTEKTSHSLYVYKNGNKTYLEIPYYGVYRVDAELFDILDRYLSK